MDMCVGILLDGCRMFAEVELSSHSCFYFNIVSLIKPYAGNNKQRLRQGVQEFQLIVFAGRTC